LIISRKIKKFLPFTIILSAIVISFILTLTKKDESKINFEKVIPKINAFLVKSQDFTFYINSEGHIKSKTEFQLLSEVSGEVLFLSNYFDNNLIFSKGDTLIKVDSANYSIARRNAKANLDIAVLENLQQKAIYDRSQTELGQYNNNQVSDLAKKIPQLQSSNSLLDAAKANYEKTELDIEKTIVLAPFKGRVKKNYISKGMHIAPGMKLASIYSIEDMFVKLPLSIDDTALLGLSRDKTGIIGEDDISVDLEVLIGDKKYNIKGQYMGVSGSIDKMTQKIYLNAGIDNLSKNIIIDDNLFVNAKIYGKKYKQVFLIPNEAIIKNNYVNIVRNQKIYKQKIQILKKYKDYSIINKGLKNGDIINLTRLDYYLDGMEIEVIK